MEEEKYFRRLSRVKQEEGQLVCNDLLRECLKESEGEECYISHFCYPSEALLYFQSNIKQNGKSSLAGYQGPVFAERVYLDIDSSSIDDALKDCRLIIRTLIALGFTENNLGIWFSGRRGFHIGFSVTPWGLLPGEKFNQLCKKICCEIARRAGVEIDKSIYTKLSLLRAPFSKHPGTGLFKTPISVGNLLRGEIVAGDITASCKNLSSWEVFATPTAPSIDLRSRFKQILNENTQASWKINDSLKKGNYYPTFSINWQALITWPFWNEVFYKLAALAKIRGYSSNECEKNLKLLRDTNETGSPQHPHFSDAEIQTIVRSVYSRDYAYHVSLRKDRAIKDLIIPGKRRVK